MAKLARVPAAAVDADREDTCHLGVQCRRRGLGLRYVGRIGAPLPLRPRRLRGAACISLLSVLVGLAGCSSPERVPTHEEGVRSVVAHLEGVT